MAKTPPFFQHNQHATGLRSAAPGPVRYPYHDNDGCPVGQQVKAGGEWQYYEPTRIEETRARCPHCVSLDAAYTRET
ncbi:MULTISPECIES: hypothetical protein [Hymenobacter]|uniref:Uncharacterized protein n=2 Tax=Hymenobacter TaxID=89966 RepID=A0A4Z0MC85_9BACT|nr:MULTISPECIES: hypothetical protein [Hymenobacter]TGD77343.1 hypothetical protein EU557_23565 [Hymenobacter wooponensis]TGE03561.1 hypothetical protein EU556_25560 [Hymenobacter fodinae]